MRPIFCLFFFVILLCQQSFSQERLISAEELILENEFEKFQNAYNNENYESVIEYGKPLLQKYEKEILKDTLMCFTIYNELARSYFEVENYKKSIVHYEFIIKNELIANPNTIETKSDLSFVVLACIHQGKTKKAYYFIDMIAADCESDECDILVGELENAVMLMEE